MVQHPAGLYRRFQRGEGAVQERGIHGVGCGWAGEATTSVAPLLQQHRRPHFRYRFTGSGANPKSCIGVQGAPCRGCVHCMQCMHCMVCCDCLGCLGLVDWNLLWLGC